MCDEFWGRSLGGEVVDKMVKEVLIMAALEDVKKALKDTLGQGANINPANPLQTEDAAVSPAKGTTSANGNVGGTTVIDITRTEGDGHWDGMTLLITSGAQSGQFREIVSWFKATGTFTVAPAFGGQILAGVNYKVIAELPSLAAVAAIKVQTDKIPSLRFEDKLPTTPNVDNVASAAATNLTAGSVTPTFPTGATRRRALLFCFLHASNQGANTHNIGLKVQGQKAGGGYSDLLDLTTTVPVSMVNIAGAMATFAVVIDVTALVDTSGVQYDFRFVVDSDNAGSVNYTSNFTLTLIYSV